MYNHSLCLAILYKYEPLQKKNITSLRYLYAYMHISLEKLYTKNMYTCRLLNKMYVEFSLYKEICLKTEIPSIAILLYKINDDNNDLDSNCSIILLLNIYKLFSNVIPNRVTNILVKISDVSKLILGMVTQLGTIYIQ